MELHPQQHQLHQVSPRHCPCKYIHLVSSPVHASFLMTVSCIDVSTPQQNANALQEGLDNLQQWEKDWQMKFNPDKCGVIRIINKRKVVDSAYTIHGQTLRCTEKAKYLGVRTYSTSSWKKLIDTITKKANNTTAFLRQNLLPCLHDVKATCYKALVRHQLEFASSILDPHRESNNNKIEAMQRRAARFVTGDNRRTKSVESILEHLGYKDIHTRRQHGKMILMYRIINHLVETPASQILQLVGVSRTSGRNHRYLVP